MIKVRSAKDSLFLSKDDRRDTTGFISCDMSLQMQTERSPCASRMNGLWAAAPNGRLILAGKDGGDIRSVTMGPGTAIVRLHKRALLTLRKMVSFLSTKSRRGKSLSDWQRDPVKAFLLPPSHLPLSL